MNLDKNAKAPLTREQRGKNIQVQANESEQNNAGSPPLARPIYRPPVVRTDNNISSDFDDLPGEEQTLQPNSATPLPMNQNTPAPKREAPKQDALENLINEVQ